MAILTSRTLATGVTGTDLIHIVIPTDTSQNPEGSSYKATIQQVVDFFDSDYVHITGDTMTGRLTTPEVVSTDITAVTINSTNIFSTNISATTVECATTAYTQDFVITNPSVTASTSKNILVRNSTTGLIETRQNFAFGSFYSTSSQTTTAGVIKAMTFNFDDIVDGVSRSGTTGFTVSENGVYDVQFSAQLLKTAGGGADATYIWPRVNGNNVPQSNSSVSLATNGDSTVAAWNFFISLNVGDVLELVWTNSVGSVELHANATPTYGPEIPSVIVTIQKVD